MNLTKVKSLEVAAFCGKGNVRALNEDKILIDGILVESETPVHELLANNQDHLIVLADGMGGHARGEIASEIATKAIGGSWQSRRESFEPIEASRLANRAVYDAMQRDTDLRGMGTTVVGVHVGSSGVAWFNLGDSRGYLFRNRKLVQFTIDHVPRGATSAGRRRTHGITQSIGGGVAPIDVWPAVGRFLPQGDDLILLCTDGLTDVVMDGSIDKTLKEANTIIEAVKQLLQQAENAGAPDNISLALLRF
jgi:protein phosphatase